MMSMLSISILYLPRSSLSIEFLTIFMYLDFSPDRRSCVYSTAVVVDTVVRERAKAETLKVFHGRNRISVH